MAATSFSFNSFILKSFKFNPVFLTVSRNSSFFKKYSNTNEHSENNYKFEVSKDPNEWEHVERLMPFKTVPEPKPKPVYPSGWRPMKESSLELPYFVERTKNHMLSVYLTLKLEGQSKITSVKKIHGDIWGLHDELKSHIEQQIGRKISSYVHEGNNVIFFRGDFVYYVEQWLLSKGF